MSTARTGCRVVVVLFALVAVAALLSLATGTVAADGFYRDTGTVVVEDDPDARDRVTFFVPQDRDDPRAVATDAVRNAGLPVRDVEFGSNRTTRVTGPDGATMGESGYVEVEVTTTVGERTGFRTGRIDAETLAALAVFPDTELVVQLPAVVSADGVGDRIGDRDGDPVYAVEEDRAIGYVLPTSRLGVVAAVLAAAFLVPLLVTRLYARRVAASDDAVEAKLHRLRRAGSIGVLPLALALVATLFETDAIPVLLLSVEGVAPGATAGELGVMVAVVGGFFVPVGAALLGVFLGTFPVDRRLREAGGDRRGAVKRFLGGLAVSFVPLVAWFLLLGLLPDGAMGNDLVLIGLLGCFLLAVYALQPYLVMLFQDAAELDGEPRERLDDFCAAQDVSPRGIYRLDTGDDEVANAMVTGLVPGFTYVFLTDDLLAQFPDAEVEAVLAHELGHLTHRHLWYRAGLALAVFGGWILLPGATGFDGLTAQFGFYGFFLPFLGVLLLYLVVGRGWLAVRQEYAADAYAAAVTDPETTAAALDRLAEVNVQQRQTGTLYQRLNLHPSIADRIEALGVDSDGLGEDAGSRGTATPED